MARPIWTEHVGALARLYWLYALAAAALAYLVVNNLLEKGVQPSDRLMMLAIAVASFIGLYRIEFPKGAGAREMKSRGGRARLMGIVLSVFGVLSAAIGMVAPRPVVEDQPGLIQSLVRTIAGDVRTIRDEQRELRADLGLDSDSAARRGVVGIWGDESCTTLRRIAVQGQSLVIDTVRVPTGIEPLRWTFTIEKEADELPARGMRSSILTTTERTGLHPGQAVKFRYQTDGTTEQLVWEGASPEQAAPRLQRCPAP